MTILQVNSHSIDQKSGEIWTAQANLQPISFKSDRLLGVGVCATAARPVQYATNGCTMENVNLTHHFLIAMPNMADPYFSKSLTYICEHNEQGALGIVLTRPVDLTLSALLEQIDIPTTQREISDVQVHFGGPVQMDRGFVLHKPAGEWQSTLRVNDEIGLTTSRDILEAVARGEGPEKIFITLGYAGWAPGQLEHEMSLNAWLSVAADTTLIFDLPLEARFDAAMHLLGIDTINLSEDAGHA